MKIVLSKDGVKREITTPFAMCIGREDLSTLIDALMGIQGSMLARSTSYGWVRVDPDHPDSNGPANTPPLPWSAT